MYGNVASAWEARSWHSLLGRSMNYGICPILNIVFQGLVIPFLLTHIPTLSLLQGREATRAAGWLYPWFSRRPSYWHVREMIWSSLMASGSWWIVRGHFFLFLSFSQEDKNNTCGRVDGYIVVKWVSPVCRVAALFILLELFVVVVAAPSSLPLVVLCGTVAETCKIVVAWKKGVSLVFRTP